MTDSQLSYTSTTVIENDETTKNSVTENQHHKYTDTLATLKKIDSNEVPIDDIATKIQQLKAKAKSKKVADKNGNEVSEFEELLQIAEEVKAYNWGLGTHYYKAEFVKIYSDKANKDVGAIITAKIEKLRKALMTPKRTMEWALSDELSSPNWDIEGEEKKDLIAQIDQKFEEVTEDLLGWVHSKSVTNETDEIKRKKMWGDKAIKSNGSGLTAEQWSAHKKEKGWTK